MQDGQDTRISDLFGIELPIIQAPMAGCTTPAMVIAVSEAGGLGSLPGAMYAVEGLAAALETVRAATRKPINLNFFVHRTPVPDPARHAAWVAQLAPYYREWNVDPATATAGAGRAPFDATYGDLVERYRPDVVSFHFGLPAEDLLDRVQRTGAKVIASATTVTEARWLAERGVDAVIAMGWEAGGHRGHFLSDDMDAQLGTLALVPQIVDAIRLPVIAAGGIADPRGVRAAFALGASAVQVGTAYLYTPEASVPDYHRRALQSVRDDQTALSNLFTGRPARGIVNRLMREQGPLSSRVPAFPTAGSAIAPLRMVAEQAGVTDFSPMWAGQAASLARPMSSAELTRYLAGL